MKQLLFLSLFFFSAWTYIGASIPFLSVNPDSLKLYRKISGNKELGFQERLNASNKAVQFAREISDSTYLSQLQYRSTIYGSFKKYEDALQQANLLLEEATRLEQPYFIALSYEKFGRYNAAQQNDIKAFKNYVKAIDLYTAVGDSSKIIKVSKRASFIQSQIGDLDGTEFTIVNALDYSDALEDVSELAWFYDVLGRVYRDRKLWQESIRNHRKALQLEVEPESKVALLNNYAITLIKATRYYEAIIQLNTALEYGAESSPRTTHRLLDNLAFAKAKLKQPEAINLLEKALALRIADNDMAGQYASHIHLTEAYDEIENNQAKAKYHAEQAYEIASQLKNTEAIVRALDFLIPLTPKSNTLFELRTRLSDSLEGAQNQAKFEFAKLRYDVEKAEERELLALRLKSASEQREEIAVRRRNWALLALLGLGLLTLVFILYQKERSKKQRLLDQYNTEKRLAKKLHDELANEIYLVMTQLESDKSTPQVADKLEDIYKMSRDISRETRPIQTGKTFAKELALSLQTYTSDNRKLILRGLETVQWQQIDATKKVEIYRVFQELMTNMKKHSEATLVALVFQVEEKLIKINYSDNGKGILLKPEDRNSGLENIKTRLKALQGEVDFDSAIDEGFRAIITIPI